MLLRLFHFMAHHGLKLSATTEHRIEQALPSLAVTPLEAPNCGFTCRKTLVQPHAGEALRAMHSLRLLTLLLPELKPIDRWWGGISTIDSRSTSTRSSRLKVCTA